MNILVAEDEKDLLKLITYQLEQEGYLCTAVIAVCIFAVVFCGHGIENELVV